MIPRDARFLESLREAFLLATREDHRDQIILLGSGSGHAIRELCYRQSEGPMRLSAILRGLRSLAPTARSLLALLGGDASTALASLDRATDADAPTGTGYTAITAAIDLQRAPLVDAALLIARRLETGPVPFEWATCASDFLAELVANEEAEAGRPAAAEPEASEGFAKHIPALQGWLAKTLDAPGLQITGHKPCGGGFSRLTIAIETDHDGVAGAYIVRAATGRRRFVSDIGRTLAEEYPLIRLVRKHGVLAPEVHALETDPCVLGQDFMLMAHCPGVIVGNTMTSAHVDSEIIATFARQLAAIHTLPWRDHLDELPARMADRPTLTVAEGTAVYYRRAREYLAGCGLRPSPALTLSLDWLERNIPPGNAPAVLFHGDIGFHNTLFARNTITALLDWDACDVGSPMRDLMPVRLMLTADADWEMFVEQYVAAGGEPPRSQDMDYFMAFRSFTTNMACAVALEHMFEDAASMAYLEWGLGARPFYLAMFRDWARAHWPPQRSSAT